MLALDDGELVNRQPVVVRGVLVVEDGDLRSTHGAPSGPVLDRHTVHQHPVERTVPGFQSGAFRLGQLAECVLHGFCGQGRVLPLQGVAQPLFQNDFGVVRSLRVRRVRGNVRTVGHLPPEAPQPFECGVFDLRLGEGRRDTCHVADSTTFSASGTRISPEMSLGSNDVAQSGNKQCGISRTFVTY